MPLCYASLAEVKDELKTEKSTDDAYVLNYARQASQRLDRLFQSRRAFFFPYIENRAIPVYPDTIKSSDNTLDFGSNLLALTSVTAGDQTVSNVELYPPYESPARKLRLTSTSLTWYYYQPTDKPLLAVINGIWGFHRDYPNAWLKVDDLAADLTINAVTLTVADVDGTDDYGRSPRISAGNLMRIGTEFLEVISTNTTTNVVTVKRGALGSTAATHTTRDDVEIWQVEEPVKRAVARQAAFMYARRGTFESSMVTELASVQFPADLLNEVLGVVQGYAYS